MLIAALFILFTSAWFVSITRGSEGVAKLAAAPLALAFVLIYVCVSTQVAQDREQYYQWYSQAATIWRDGDGTDPFFTLLLTTLPERLTKWSFGVVFSCILFAALAAFAHGASRGGPSASITFSLVMLTAVTDRLFLDLCANTSRSALACMLLLTALVIRNPGWAVLLVAVAAAIHAKFTALAFALGVVAYVLRNRPTWQRSLLLVGLLLFVARAATGRTFFDGLAIIDLFLQSEREDFRRGVLISTGVTASRAIQITIAVLLPLTLAVTLPSNAEISRTLNNKRYPFLRSTAVTFSGAALVLYPEIQLAERLFLVPLLLLPILMPLGRLKTLAAIKIPIICVVLLAQFQKLY